MGGELNDFGIFGVKVYGFIFWLFEDFVRICEYIEKIVVKVVLELNDELCKVMLIFVVCGFGFTGIEMIGELIDWKNCLVKDYKLDLNEIILMVVEVMLIILNMLDWNDVVKVECYLCKYNVELLLNVLIVEVVVDYIKLKDGCNILIYILIWIVGVKGIFDVVDFGLEVVCG